MCLIDTCSPQLTWRSHSIGAAYLERSSEKCTSDFRSNENNRFSPWPVSRGVPFVGIFFLNLSWSIWGRCSKYVFRSAMSHRSYDSIRPIAPRVINSAMTAKRYLARPAGSSMSDVSYRHTVNRTKSVRSEFALFAKIYSTT